MASICLNLTFWNKFFIDIWCSNFKSANKVSDHGFQCLSDSLICTVYLRSQLTGQIVMRFACFQFSVPWKLTEAVECVRSQSHHFRLFCSASILVCIKCTIYRVKIILNRIFRTCGFFSLED